MSRHIETRAIVGAVIATVVLGLMPAGSPVAALGDDRKRSLGLVEMGFFRNGTENDVFYKESGHHDGRWYEIYKSSTDPNLGTKVAAIHRAVETLGAQGVHIPYGLRVYCSDHPVAQNRAFPRDEAFEPVALVTLKWAGPGGVGNSLSAQGFLGFDRPTISMIHEIGHILHERNVGDPFWETGSFLSRPPRTAGKVSGYAGRSRKEFVAEVFTGLVLGRVWPGDVMNEYHRYRGPAVPGAPR